MITYKITDTKLTPGAFMSGVVSLEVDFGDGSPIYQKRMMAPVVEGKQALTDEIEAWIAAFAEARTVEAPKVSDDVAALVGVSQQYAKKGVSIDGAGVGIG